MADLKKQLKPHAVTCIKDKLFEHIKALPNVDLAYTVHCDREDCWDQTELIDGYLCAVNIRENGFTTGEQSKKNGICYYKSELDIDLQVYANGCNNAIDLAMSVLADVIGGLNSCKGNGFPYAKRINDYVLRRDVETGYSIDKTLITQSITLDFDWAPCMPSKIWTYK